MTSASKIATILKKLGDAHYQAADELLALASEQPAASTEPAPVQRPVAVDTRATPAVPQESDFAEGSDSMCPKHKKPYTEGKFGPYCTSTSDDPAWTNARGYCRITPKNAAQYLRLRAAA